MVIGSNPCAGKALSIAVPLSSRCVEVRDSVPFPSARFELPRELTHDVEAAGLRGEQKGMLERVGGGLVNVRRMCGGRPRGAIR